MSMKKRLLKAARTPKQKKEVERMSEEEARQFLLKTLKKTDTENEERR